MEPKLILFAPPEQAQTLAGASAVPAPMIYRIGSGLTLHRAASVPDLRGGVLAIAGGTVTVQRGSGNLQLFLRQIQRESLYRGVLGVWLELDSAPMEGVAPLLSALDDLTARMKLELWVPEWCATGVKRGNILISSALSGGTLQARLEDAIASYGAGRVTLAVEPMCEDFTLPASRGQGTMLTPEALAALRKQIRPTIFYSTELCAHYFTYLKRGVPHFVLFDTPGSLEKKRLLAGTLGLRWVIAPAGALNMPTG